MKNSKVKAVRVPAGTTEPAETLTEYDVQRELSTTRQKRFIALGIESSFGSAFKSIPDQVAQSDHWIRNEPIKNGLDLFPPDQFLWYMRFSDLFYAYAKGGPLYMDTPRSSMEVMYCEQKLAKYREKGVRYTYVAAGEDVLDVALRLDPLSLPHGGQA